MSNAIQMLDAIAFGLMTNAGQGDATVTIEMEKPKAEYFLFNISRELEEFLKDYLRPMPVIGLGHVFQYRGVSFRVVERAK